MSRRRGERRHVYANVPTADGKKVAVRSSTVAGRLFGLQELVQQQSRRLTRLTEERDEARALLERVLSQRLVRVLVWLRLVSIVIPTPPATTPAVREAPVA